MRKSIFLILFALLSILSARAYDFEVDGIYYNRISGTDDQVEVTYQKYNNGDYTSNYSGSVVIPATVEYDGTTYRVTFIGEWAFAECSGLTSVTLPNSVTSIGEGAFYYCIGLISVTIPESVTSIGMRVFGGCSGLTSVTIPNSVTSIEEWAFGECSGLTSVTIPNSVTEIGGWAFCGCSGLTSVTIPNSVTFIGTSAFEECTSISSPLYNSNIFAYMPTNYSGEYTIPSGIQSIAGGAFRECTGLTSVMLPNSVTSIGEWAFQDCDGLTSVTIPESVDTIGRAVFYGCTSIRTPLYNSKIFAYLPRNYSGEYEIPSGIQSIAPNAFNYCGLTSVTIPNSVTEIGEWAFADCFGLKSVTSLARKPPYCIGAVFSVYDTLFVPRGSKEAYQTADEWKKFSKIEELPGDPDDPDTPTANEKSEADNFRVYVQDRTIYLSEDRGTVQVYNMAGQRVYNGHATAIPVRQSGVYIVVTGQQRIKVVVR